MPNLRYPIREGEHDQTAFSFGLVWDWAKLAGDADMQRLLREKAQQFYAQDRACPLVYDLSGQDFPVTVSRRGDFMRRVLDPRAFAEVARCSSAADRARCIDQLAHAALKSPIAAIRKLAHLDGLNLSRAWMLEGVARGLPERDRRITALRKASIEHRDASLAAVTSEHYVGSHWLGTFALYGATL